MRCACGKDRPKVACLSFQAQRDAIPWPGLVPPGGIPVLLYPDHRDLYLSLFQLRPDLLYLQGEENYLYSLVHMTLKQLPKIVKDDQEVRVHAATSNPQMGGWVTSRARPFVLS